VIERRLKQLRLARGLSLEALAAAMGGVVTKQALSKYETGRARPSAAVLTKLAAALGVKSAALWAEPTVEVRFVAYRKRSALLKGEQARVESLVRQSLEERVRLQELTGQLDGFALPVQSLPVDRLEDVEKAAQDLRSAWSLGLDPVASVVGVLEDRRTHVLEIEANEKFDGLSAVATKDGEVAAAAVVTRDGVPGERQRLNLAHELGHLVLKIGSGVDEERAAFRFGAAFLAPAPSLIPEIGAKRALIHPEELLVLKQRYGLSVQALLRRLRDLEVITESYYKQWCIDVNRLGWRKREPCELPREQPRWLLQSVLRAFSEGLLAKDEAERMLGSSVEMDQPLTLVERRAFMRLPLEERRRRLAEQAARMEEHYTRDREWEELEAGDLVGE
jgi:transcriptional regulator with XRE-family HTH domain